jgi:hypothetical protein
MIPANDTWRSLFHQWPASLPKQGLLVTNFGEQIPFVNFLVSDTAVLVERDKPDTIGARKVVVDYGTIAAVKLTDPSDLERYRPLGFQSPM